MALFRRFDVFRRFPGGVRIYRCFEWIEGGGFSVQSLDTIRAGDPSSVAAQCSAHEANLIELFEEIDPRDRSGSYPTIRVAIEAHDRAFGITEKDSRAEGPQAKGW